MVINAKYSKTKIDQAGDLLKAKSNQDINAVPEEIFEILSNWRAYHALPLNAFTKVLKTKIKNINLNSNTIIAQRLKRTSSIIMKLF